MNICVNSLYRLSTPQFHSLYSEDVSDEALALLIGEVENGNQNCIDLLCNLALRNDDLGHKVEKLLFDLFSGKRSGSPDIDKKINQACLVLHQIANNDITKNNTEWKKLHAPSRLLYMAGSATTKAATQGTAVTTEAVKPTLVPNSAATWVGRKKMSPYTAT